MALPARYIQTKCIVTSAHHFLWCHRARAIFALFICMFFFFYFNHWEFSVNWMYLVRNLDSKCETVSIQSSNNNRDYGIHYGISIIISYSPELSVLCEVPILFGRKSPKHQIKNSTVNRWLIRPCDFHGVRTKKKKPTTTTNNVSSLSTVFHFTETITHTKNYSCIYDLFGRVLKYVHIYLFSFLSLRKIFSICELFGKHGMCLPQHSNSLCTCACCFSYLFFVFSLFIIIFQLVGVEFSGEKRKRVHRNWALCNWAFLFCSFFLFHFLSLSKASKYWNKNNRNASFFSLHSNPNTQTVYNFSFKRSREIKNKAHK